MFANQMGCDGDRVFYDGSAMIAVNGEIVARSAQFSVQEVVSTSMNHTYAIIKVTCVPKFETRWPSGEN